MVKYQNNIVMFPIEKQMDKINRDAKRLEKKSEKLLKKSKLTQEDMDGKLVEAYKKVWGDRWEEYWYGRR
tara:strand:+ start:534 stop:743 length:210 start_codon:yes stop_codon:yes gene_type:complete